ncbi:radical SAM protein [Desulfovibrio sp. JC022]|uniref:radical SAM protein n=1 Tax=Desulfovibrio sp. JC022 TaxID=2593642 RepID=UPI0013D79EB9|nr:radical SAM protein [Desulfovibrio sp. JC022]NDV24042.1 radical SAM protein [Desulfovibrio sp. JC022]
MRSIEQYTGVEQGPIRPPSEAGSMLLRLTRNCPWNQCTFCGLYKGTKFSVRPVEHVLQDIDTMRRAVDLIEEAQKSGQRITYGMFAEFDQHVAHAAMNFVNNGMMRSIFLQDGNSLIMPPDDLIQILEHVRKCFPNVDRITSYARSQSIAKISDEDMQRISDAGLNRIHIGMESGSDAVLKAVKKGVDKARQIEAGQKVKRAGVELSEYFMPGLGGKELSRENALETADCMNRINPDFIRMRTLALPDSTPLAKQNKEGSFQKMGEVDTAKELLLFLDSLEGITSTIRSDHVLNLFSEVDGTLPHDKDKMTEPIRKFLSLSPEDQLVFCIGRRTHSLSTVADLSDKVKRFHAEQTCAGMGATVENMDEIIDSIIKRFI